MVSIAPFCYGVGTPALVRIAFGAAIARGGPKRFSSSSMTASPGFLAIVATALAVQQPADLPNLMPFGVAQSARPSELRCEPLAVNPPDSTGQYVCPAVPRPDPDYQEYILAFVQDVGICNLVAITPYTEDDDQGTFTRGMFAGITAKMTRELGEPDEKVDVAHAPAAGSDRLFKRTIMDEERQVFNQWNDLRGRFRNLQSASVALVGDEAYGLAVYSAYRFVGNDDCMRRMEQTTGLSSDR